MFLMRFGKKAGLSLAVFALSYIPYIGRLVLPAASFYTFQNVAGLGPAGIIFGTGIFLPRRYLIIFLQSYFSSRTLMRELVCLLLPTCISPTRSWSLVPANFMLLLATYTDRTPSSNRTFHEFILRKSRRNTGFTIEKAFCLGSVLDFTSFFESLSWVSSSTELLKHRRHISSPRLRILHHLPARARVSLQVSKNGETSTSSSISSFWTWMLIMTIASIK